MNLSEIREQTEGLTQRIRRRQYQFASGREAKLGLTEEFRQAHFLSRDALALVREAATSATDRRAVRLKMLVPHLANLLTLRDNSELLDEIALGRIDLAAVARVSLRDERAALERATVAGAEALQSQLAWDGWRTALNNAGYPTLAAHWSAVHDWDAGALSIEAEAFLLTTESMYFDVLEWWMDRATGQRLFPDGAERHDLLHALSLAPFQGLFPTGKKIRKLTDTIRGCGITDDSELLIDDDARDAKSPDAQAFAIDPPTSVIAMFPPDGGYTSTRDFLGALGVGLHYAQIDAARPFEDRMLGDSSLPTAFGSLLRNLLLERKWLKSTLDSAPSDLPRLLALAELFRLRHACAVLLHSLELEREGPGVAQSERYSERMLAALGARWPAALCLLECKPTLDAATDLLAAATEAALALALVERFNDDWWRNPQAGVWLRMMFAQGQLQSSREVAKSQGLGELSLKSAIQRIQNALD